MRHSLNSLAAIATREGIILRTKTIIRADAKRTMDNVPMLKQHAYPRQQTEAHKTRRQN